MEFFCYVCFNLQRMRLFILRHSIAKEILPDCDRPLTRSGIEQLDKLCSLLDPAIFRNTAQLWHSPYLRAAQSAKIFAEKLNIKIPLLQTKGLLPDDSCMEMAKAIASLSTIGADLMIVGHNPHLESLSQLLLNDKSRRCAVRFYPATFAYLELAEFPSHENEFGAWHLKSLISPTLLK